MSRGGTTYLLIVTVTWNVLRIVMKKKKNLRLCKVCVKVPGQLPPCDNVLFESKGIPIDPCLRSNPLRRKPRDEETKYLPNEERWNFGTRVSHHQILQGPPALS